MIRKNHEKENKIIRQKKNLIELRKEQYLHPLRDTEFCDVSKRKQIALI